MRNLRSAGFKGSIGLVNPHYDEIEGIKALKTIQELPQAPDLLVIATPPQSVPGIVAAAGEKGVATAIIITAGLGHGTARSPTPVRKRRVPPASDWSAQTALACCRREPSSTPVLRRACRQPAISRSFRSPAPSPQAWSNGRLRMASVFRRSFRWEIRSTSTSATCSISSRSIGATRAILLYIELINNARKFMSAARAAARIKPVVVVKSGRHAQGAKAAQTHTGALAGPDAVYDAAFRRAGLLRVLDLDELFAAAETLGRVRPFPGKRLAILTNGGGIGVLAVDRLVDLGGTLAGISPER